MRYLIFFMTLLFFAMPPLLADDKEVPDIFAPTLQPPPVATAKTEAKSQVKQLEGIGYGPKKAFAVINGKIYTEGEKKEGVQVLKIRKKEVDIIDSGVKQ